MDVSNKLAIIGISGTNGSGKDTLGHMLADHHGYLFVSVTELLRAECTKRGIAVSRENLRMVSAEWRREQGLGVLVDKAVEEYTKAKDKYNGVAIASLRNPGEADSVHSLGGTVVWIDADPKIRYQRIQASSHIRSHRAHEDDKTFEEFLAEEQAEMHASGDAATLDMSAVKDRADIKMDNSFENSEQFRLEAEKTLDLNK
jgi:cytidylate kinase